MKLDGDGLYQWHTFYGSEGDDGDSSGEGTGISTIENGDIIITGYSSLTWDGENGEGPLHPHSGIDDIAIFDLTKNGSYQWHTFYGSPGADHGFDITSTADNELYVSGYSQESWLGDDNEEPLHAHSGSKVS
jgi:hypothetical protein